MIFALQQINKYFNINQRKQFLIKTREREK